MTENVCIMLTSADFTNVLVDVLTLATAAVDLNKRTVLYLGGRWVELARVGNLEKRDNELKGLYKGLSILEHFRHFQQAGGLVWVSSREAQHQNIVKHPLIAGISMVDEKTLFGFLTPGTVVLNF